MARLSDTSPEAERVLIEVYRRMPAGQKWLHLGEMFRDAKALHAAGFRLRNPGATPRQVHEDWLALNLNFRLTNSMRGPAPESPRQSLPELRAAIRRFTDLGIPYAVCGSLASSVHGIARFGWGADLAVEPFPGREAQLTSAFGPDYYVSLPAIHDAVRDRSSFNIVNTTTAFKVDIFLRKDSPFERTAMQRRVPLQLPDVPDQPIVFHTAEDTILFKLRWYRLGGEASDQQWRDILGVLKVQAGKLDEAYLDHWAADLGVTDLLARARQESAP